MRVGDGIFQGARARSQSEAHLFRPDAALGIAQERDGEATMSSIYRRVWTGCEHSDSPVEGTPTSPLPHRGGPWVSGAEGRCAQKPKSSAFFWGSSHQTPLG